MLLSARCLDSVGGVNIYQTVDQLQFSRGDQTVVYLQLLNLALDRADQGFNPPGRRYVPVGGATLQVTLNHLDSAKQLLKVATQPFPGDGSIWSFTVNAGDTTVQGTVDLLLSLNESGVIRTGRVKAALWVDTPSDPL